MNQETWIAFGIGFACCLLPVLVMRASRKKDYPTKEEVDTIHANILDYLSKMDKRIELFYEQNHQLTNAIVTRESELIKDRIDWHGGELSKYADIFIGQQKGLLNGNEEIYKLIEALHTSLLHSLQNNTNTFHFGLKTITERLTDIELQTKHIPVRGKDGKLKKQNPEA